MKQRTLYQPLNGNLRKPRRLIAWLDVGKYSQPYIWYQIMYTGGKSLEKHISPKGAPQLKNSLRLDIWSISFNMRRYTSSFRGWVRLFDNSMISNCHEVRFPCVLRGFNANHNARNAVHKRFPFPHNAELRASVGAHHLSSANAAPRRGLMGHGYMLDHTHLVVILNRWSSFSITVGLEIRLRRKEGKCGATECIVCHFLLPLRCCWEGLFERAKGSVWCYNLPPLPRRIVHEVTHQLSIFFEAITCDNYCLGSAIEASKLTPFKSWFDNDTVAEMYKSSSTFGDSPRWERWCCGRRSSSCS